FLTAKRKFSVQVARMMPLIREPRLSPVPKVLNSSLHCSTRPAYEKVESHDDEFSFRFLNVERKFSLPIDWHRPDLNTGTRLWKLNLHYFDYASELDDASF